MKKGIIILTLVNGIAAILVIACAEDPHGFRPKPSLTASTQTVPRSGGTNTVSPNNNGDTTGKDQKSTSTQQNAISFTLPEGLSSDDQTNVKKFIGVQEAEIASQATADAHKIIRGLSVLRTKATQAIDESSEPVQFEVQAVVAFDSASVLSLVSTGMAPTEIATLVTLTTKSVDQQNSDENDRAQKLAARVSTEIACLSRDCTAALLKYTVRDDESKKIIAFAAYYFNGYDKNDSRGLRLEEKDSTVKNRYLSFDTAYSSAGAAAPAGGGASGGGAAAPAGGGASGGAAAPAGGGTSGVTTAPTVDIANADPDGREKLVKSMQSIVDSFINFTKSDPSAPVIHK